jgi:copper(I)-binding protein
MIPIFHSKMKTAAGYFTIVNKRNKTDELIMVKTDFAKAMMHLSKIDENGIVSMEHVNKVIIPGNSSVVFEQGSLHIMFTQLKEPLEEFMDQKVTLVFKNLGEIVVDFQVEKVTQKMNMKNNHDH